LSAGLREGHFRVSPTELRLTPVAVSAGTLLFCVQIAQGVSNMTKASVKAIVALGMSLGLLLAGSSVEAQKTKGKSRASTTKYLMAGISQPHCKALGDQLKSSGPFGEKAWDTAACHAACLNELSYLLMDDGRCPDATWAEAVKSLRTGSAAALQAAKDQDLAAAKAAFKQVTQGCATCHKAHRK
jgi:cytochrome c556